MNTVEIDITDCRYVVVSGGVGGAKLALGMYLELSGEELLVIGNVGDDFKHWGLHISPDLDTLMYTLPAWPILTVGGEERRSLGQFLRRCPISVELIGFAWVIGISLFISNVQFESTAEKTCRP